MAVNVREIQARLNSIEDTLDTLELILKAGRKDKTMLIPRKVWVRDPSKEGGGYFAIRWVKIDEPGKETIIYEQPESEVPPEVLKEIEPLLSESSIEGETATRKIIEEKITDKPPAEKDRRLTDLLNLLSQPIPKEEPVEPKRGRVKKEKLKETKEASEIEKKVMSVVDLPYKELPPGKVKDPVTGGERNLLNTPDKVVSALESGEYTFTNLTPEEVDLLLRSKPLKEQLFYATRGYPLDIRLDIQLELITYALETALKNYDPSKAKLSTYLAHTFGEKAKEIYKKLTGKPTVPYDTRTFAEQEREAEKERYIYQRFAEDPAGAAKTFGGLAYAHYKRLTELQDELANRLAKLPKDPLERLALVSQLQAIEETPETRELRRIRAGKQAVMPRSLKDTAIEVWNEAGGNLLPEQRSEKQKELMRRLTELGVRSAEDLHKKLSQAWTRLVSRIRDDPYIHSLYKELKEEKYAFFREVFKARKLLEILKAWVGKTKVSLSDLKNWVAEVH